MKVLYVDDEQGNLTTFRLTFNRKYDVVTCNSAREALDFLAEKGELPVIITDQRMPDMTGIEFLSRVIKDFPDTVRIILTAYTDADALIEAINTGKAYRYIVKPWNSQELEQTLKGAFDHYILTKQNRALLDELQGKNRDLTNALDNLKRAQELLIVQEKRAAVGNLAAGLAHEVKNLLNPISLLDFFVDELSEESRKDVQLIFEARNRIVNLVDEVRALAKNEEADYQLSLQDLKPAIEEAVYLARLDPAVRNKTIAVEFNHSSFVRFNKDKILQVLLNLIGNAAHALADNSSGRIVVRTEQLDAVVHVHVIDNGVGINEVELQKIWEPFFTTKGARGTGIGLDISKRIIEGHGGTISCASKLNQGSDFRFTLPAVS